MGTYSRLSTIFYHSNLKKNPELLEPQLFPCERQESAGKWFPLTCGWKKIVGKRSLIACEWYTKITALFKGLLFANSADDTSIQLVKSTCCPRLSCFKILLIRKLSPFLVSRTIKSSLPEFANVNSPVCKKLRSKY